MQRSEFERGFLKAKKKHRSLHKTLAWNFIRKLDRMHEENRVRPRAKRHELGFLIRLALNEVEIGDPDERKKYASLAGTIYSARKKFHTKKERRTAATPPFGVTVNEKGQLGWKL